MASWSEFTNAAPSLAAAIRAALHQYGAGLGYLATIRPDGGPRIHPVSPAVVGGGLYCCLLDTPKRRDLERDGRYALHAFPAEETDDEASVRGSARLVTDPGVVRRVAAQLRAETRLDWWLYELTGRHRVVRAAGRRVATTLDRSPTAARVSWTASRCADRPHTSI